MPANITFLTQGIFRRMELLAYQNNLVLWACNETYSESLYVSSNYSSIWKRDVSDFYSSFEVWASYLVDKDTDGVISALINRNTLINPNHTECYGFYLPDGKIQWCIDRCFSLKNFNNECMLVAGVAIPVSQDQLSGIHGKDISDLLDRVIIEYYNLLTKPQDEVHQNYTPAFINSLSQLSEREKETFELLLTGLTSKQIANQFEISHRTIEGHINSIKNKFKVGSKSELISIAIENNCINVALPPIIL